MTLADLKERALSYALSQVADVSHGEGHIRRVIKNALRLAENYPIADRDILYLAAALHDCGQKEQLERPGVHHADAGAKKAKAWLASSGAGEAVAERVAQIIAAHSSRALSEASGLEARLLFDADKLEMAGAVGLSRALIYALDRGEELYSDKGESFYSVAKNDMEFVLSGLFTPEAREIARDRLELGESFLKSLKAEADIDD